MPLHRAAWLVTVLAAFVLAVLLVFSGYQGYAAVSAAVGLAAATNLRERRDPAPAEHDPAPAPPDRDAT